MTATTYEALRAAAEEAVRREPAIEAVVLFGSRARGTAHTASDWDVAVLAAAGHEAEAKHEARKLEALETVETVTLVCDTIDKRRNDAGTVHAAIAREGRTLAGKWDRPTCRNEDLRMAPEDFAHDMKWVTDNIRTAVLTLGIDREEGRSNHSAVAITSQMAAENLGKNIVAAFGLIPRKTHDLGMLGLQLRDAFRGRKDTEHQDWGERIRTLDGNTKLARASQYAGADREPIADTIRRIMRTQTLQAEWLECARTHQNGLDGETLKACRQIVREVARLRAQPEWKHIPHDLQVSTDQWCERTNQLAEKLAPWRPGATVPGG